MEKTCGLIAEGVLPFGDASPRRTEFEAAYSALIRGCGCGEFICGMERGAELLGAELVLKMRAETGAKLWGVLSSEEQWTGWSHADSDRLFRAMERADYEYRLADRASPAAREAQLRFIAGRSQVLIVTAEAPSDSLRALLVSAAARGCEVYILDPVTLSVTELPRAVVHRD